MRSFQAATSIGTLGILAALAMPAQANLRAPRHLEQAPSSALIVAPPAQGAPLVVSGETLEFSCDSSCQVSAVYSVTAPAGGNYAFSFVLPQSAAVTAQVNDAPPSAATTSEFAADPATNDVDRDGPAQRAEARFRGALRPGENRITVRYQQPLANQETDYGYFRKGRFIESFRYELWPLKQWQRAPEFTLRLTVTLPRKPPGFWARHSGKYKSIKCQGAAKTTHDGAPLQGQLQQQNAVLRYEAVLREFPDRLECMLGDADLLGK